MAEDFLPYLNTFIESIHDCVSRHTHLFTDEELLQLQELLRLPVTHQHLLSRLVLRKHEWLRTNSFTNYLGRCYTQQDIDVTVHGLLANSTIDSITSKTPFEDVWNAITTTLTVEELSSLLVMISSKKAKVVGKTNILLELQKIVHKQKNLFGHLLKNTLGKALASVLSSHETNPCLLVRVKPSILLLIRRVQRLHQATFSISSISLFSAYEPIAFNAPLMAAFRKIVFKSYSLNEKLKLFENRRKFLQWEIAMELRYIVDKISFDKSLSKSAQKQLVIFQRLKEVVLGFYSTLSANSDDGEECMNTMSVLDGLMRRYEVDQSNRDSSAATVYDGQWSAEEKEKTVEGYQQKLLFLIGQIVSILYVSYCSRYDYYIDRNFAQSLKNDEILREDNAPMYEKQRQHEFDPLEYLIKYDAGTHLAYLFHDISASSYEKQNVKEYEIAILHYEYLLSSKFLTHRRGKWYIRLCICYSHLKLFQCAIRAALRGLLDTFVVVSDKTDLCARFDSILAKLSRTAIKDDSKDSQPHLSEKLSLYKDKLFLQQKRDLYPDFYLLTVVFGINCTEIGVEEALAHSIIYVIGRHPVDSDSSNRIAATASTSNVVVEKETVLYIENMNTLSTKLFKNEDNINNSKPNSNNIEFKKTAVQNKQMNFTWYCSLCTFINTEENFFEMCEMCFNPNDYINLQASAGPTQVRNLSTTSICRSTGSNGRSRSEDTHKVKYVSCSKDIVIDLVSSDESDCDCEDNNTAIKSAEAAKSKLNEKTLDEVKTSQLGSTSTSISNTIKNTIDNTSTILETTPNIKEAGVDVAIAVESTKRKSLMDLINGRYEISDSDSSTSSERASKKIRRSIEPTSGVSKINNADECNVADEDEYVGSFSDYCIKRNTPNASQKRTATGRTISSQINPSSCRKKKVKLNSYYLSSTAREIDKSLIKSVENEEDAIEVLNDYSTTQTSSNATKKDKKSSASGFNLNINDSGKIERNNMKGEQISLEAINAVKNPATQAHTSNEVINGSPESKDFLSKMYFLQFFSVIMLTFDGDSMKEPFISLDDSVFLWKNVYESISTTLDTKMSFIEDFFSIAKSLNLSNDESQITQLINATRTSTESNGRIYYHLDHEFYRISCNEEIDNRMELFSTDSREKIIYFAVNGRRFQDRKKGKSRFICVDGNTSNVENYVSQKCYNVDIDEDIDLNEKKDPILSSRSNVKNDSEFKLSTLSLSVLTPYTSAIDRGSWEGWHCEGSIIKSIFGLLFWDILFDTSDHCNTFLTKYQDGPLDLGYSSFFHSRLIAIFERLDQIQQYSNHEILEELKFIYQGNFGILCRAVNWNFPLSLLQLVAICIGSMGLAAICKAYASNYKHFYGGAPDLLLVRVKKVFKQRTSDTSHGSGTDSNLDRNKVEVSTQIVPLEELLGVNWKTYGNILIDSEDKDWNSLLPTKKNDSRGYIPAEQINADGTTDMNEGWESEQGDNEPEPKDDATFSQNLCEIQLPEARFICNSLDDFQNCTNQDDFHGEQSFLGLCCEVFFVEVKGPTDHLAYRQYVWLQILATHNRAAVCFVKEKSLKMLMEKEGKALLKIGEDVEI